MPDLEGDFGRDVQIDVLHVDLDRRTAGLDPDAGRLDQGEDRETTRGSHAPENCTMRASRHRRPRPEKRVNEASASGKVGASTVVLA
jgi:hypothetical protein